MPSINMIAPRRAEKQRVERDIRRAVFVILAEVIVALVLGGWFFTRTLTAGAQINALKLEIQKLSPVVKQIEEYKTATAQLKPKLKLLSEAKTGTMRWYNTLDRLTESLPDSTYLTKISTGAVKTGNEDVNVKMNGLSASQAKVGEAMLRLQTIPDFQAVDLHYTQKANTGSVTALEFEVAGVMKSDESAKGVKANGSSKS